MQTSYNDFAGEIIHESYRTGKPRKPNRNNPITQGKNKLMREMKQQAKAEGRDVPDVAMDHVLGNQGALQKYVISKGETPDTNPVGLSVQAFSLRKNEIENFADAMGCSHDDAEAYLEEAESKAMEISSPEADSFLGEIFGAIGQVAAKGAKKIADKKKAQGKKAGFWDFIASLDESDNSTPDAKSVGAATDQAANKLLDDAANKGGIGAFLKGIVDGAKNQETKTQVNKYLPYIIIGLIAIILITVLIAKNASHRK